MTATVQKTILLETSASTRSNAPTKRTIVIGVDCSSHSEATVEWAAHHFVRDDDRVLIVHAMRPAAPVSESDSQDVATNKKELEQIRVTQTKNTLLKLSQSIVEKGIPMTLLIAHGDDPRAVLLHIVDEHMADTLVIGSHGEGSRLTELLMGSVAKDLSSQSKVPVVVVRGTMGVAEKGEMEGDVNVEPFAHVMD